jgi:hypothetical protein
VFHPVGQYLVRSGRGAVATGFGAARRLNLSTAGREPGAHVVGIASNPADDRSIYAHERKE